MFPEITSKHITLKISADSTNQPNAQTSGEEDLGATPTAEEASFNLFAPPNSHWHLIFLMTTPVIEPQTSKKKSPTSSSFNLYPSPSKPSSPTESKNLTDLQSRLFTSSSALVAMNSNERFHLPDQLTRNNFLDWEGKVISVLQWKDLYDLVLDKEEKCCDEKGQFVVKDKDPIRLHQLNQAHAIMYTRIHSCLTGRLSQNGGKDCPIALWKNIQLLGASKKKANAFKAWVKLNGLNLRIDNISQFSTD
ncbi:hypothetical protein H4Q26_008054 [Puccinia striiformis f. sp. tritici PST-130]|nr:hypothetical protein H4Q26_008054 [Puccinia striiformis f. sp. tritici PST-130]